MQRSPYGGEGGCVGPQNELRPPRWPLRGWTKRLAEFGDYHLRSAFSGS